MIRVIWEPQWYNLDDSIEVGREDAYSFLVPADPSEPHRFNMGLGTEKSGHVARARVVSITHARLGPIRAVRTHSSFEYTVVPENGAAILINSEEEPGAIWDGKDWIPHDPSDWVFEVEVELVTAMGRSRRRAPLFSVLTPCYNARAYLPATYECLRAQTIADWEWIVADDGSTDGSDVYIQELSHEDGRVRLVRCPRSGRPAPGRNAALLQARGEYIALLDADDLFEPDKLKRQHEVLHANPDAIVYHEMESFWSEETGLTGVPPNGWQREPLDAATFEALLVRGNFVPTSSIAVRRALVSPDTFMDEHPELRGMEDYDFVLRYAKERRILRVPGVLGRYRVHHNSLWSSANREPRERLARMDSVRWMLEQKGHLASPQGAGWLAKYHLLRAETLLRLLDGGCRRDFALTVRHNPTNPRRWIGLGSWVMPLALFRTLYFSVREWMTGLPAAGN
jgi:glycosyltransferase involved in cell wall biosynthesis